MKVLVIGGGGREHALVLGLAQAASVSEVWAAPGNAGTAAIAKNLPNLTVDDEGAILALCQREQIGLCVVGPEAPLTHGLADLLRKAGIPVLGPGKGGAELEGSKAFSKNLMHKNGIPTASYRTFEDPRGAELYLRGPSELDTMRRYEMDQVSYPLVVKASGLAAGKGVLICEDREQALEAVHSLMVDRKFGASGSTIVIEEFLRGEEASIHTLTDGKSFFTLPTSQDHKRALDGDQGLNTGGMGAVSPSAILSKGDVKSIESRVVIPTIHALKVDGRPYRGVLYSGLMMTRSGPKVLEFNVRFGDPETQVILPRLKGDLGLLLLACAEGRLGELEAEQLELDDSPMVNVVLAAGGYPGAYRSGEVIEGLEDAAHLEGVTVFHAGTRIEGGQVVTAGGRVLGVAAKGATLQEARDRAYAAVAKISFTGMHYRKDIGARALDAEA